MNDKYRAGDYEGAQNASDNAYCWSKISIIVGIIFIVVYVVMAIISMAIIGAS